MRRKRELPGGKMRRLSRLPRSGYPNRLVLKGAPLLSVWHGDEHLGTWAVRLADRDRGLDQIPADAGWPRHTHRTLGVIRATSLGLPDDVARWWLASTAVGLHG
jgi:hypothetical protein